MFVFVFVFVLWLKKCEVRMKVDARSRLLGSVWRKEGRSVGSVGKGCSGGNIETVALLFNVWVVWGCWCGEPGVICNAHTESVANWEGGTLGVE